MTTSLTVLNEEHTKTFFRVKNLRLKYKRVVPARSVQGENVTECGGKK